MIRINLLPVRKKAKKSTARQLLVLYGLCIVLTGIGIFYLWQAQAREIDALGKREAQLRTEIAKYAKYEKLVQEIKQKKEIIERKKRGDSRASKGQGPDGSDLGPDQPAGAAGEDMVSEPVADRRAGGYRRRCEK